MTKLKGFIPREDDLEDWQETEPTQNSEEWFNAVLAKNDIARMIRDRDISAERLVYALADIEKALGKGNQPNIKSIIESEMRL